MNKNKGAETQKEKEVQEEEYVNSEQEAAKASEEMEQQDPSDAYEELKDELAKVKDQHLRLFADFENFKRRTAKEKVELYGSANIELMSALLPVLDDFNRAMKNMEEGEALNGIKLIYNKFENTLKQKGLRPMEETTGKTFDVDTMEAVTRIPAPEEALKGKVVDELEAGYYLGNKILRYARVVVGE